jgi:DNA-binding MarR family transcriptional regulator
LTVKMSEGKHQPTRDPLLASVRTLGDALARFDDAASRALGIGRTDLRALFLLEDGPATAGHIGDRLDLTSGSVTALIDRLVAAGYVTRKTDERDRRVVHVELTIATYRAIARVYAPAGRAVIGVAGSLPDDQVAVVADTLSAIASTLDGVRPGFVDDRSSGATPSARS